MYNYDEHFVYELHCLCLFTVPVRVCVVRMAQFTILALIRA